MPEHPPLRTIPLPIRALLWLIGVGFRLYFRLECQGQAHLIEALQQYGQVLAVSNHASHLDLPALVTCLGADVLRYFRLPGKKELFRNRFLAWFLRGLGVIPLEREMGDVTAARTLIRAIRAGESLGITPEGTRSPTGEILPFKSGFVRLALKFKLPVIPAAVVGTREALPKGASFPRRARIVVRIGEAMDLSGYAVEGTAEEREAALAEIVRQEVLRLYRQGA